MSRAVAAVVAVVAVLLAVSVAAGSALGSWSSSGVQSEAADGTTFGAAAFALAAGDGMWPLAIVVVVIALGAVAAAAWRSGAAAAALGDDESGGAAAESPPSSPSPPAEPDPEPRVSEEELLSDSDRVRTLLEANGGRMRQVDIVDETDWSKSKVSMLLSDMEDDGVISKLRVGRENIISLSGQEPDAAGSPFDEE